MVFESTEHSTTSQNIKPIVQSMEKQILVNTYNKKQE